MIESVFLPGSLLTETKFTYMEAQSENKTEKRL